MMRRPTAFHVIAAFDAVHHQARRLNVLRELNRDLKPDGQVGKSYLGQYISSGVIIGVLAWIIHGTRSNRYETP